MRRREFIKRTDRVAAVGPGPVREGPLPDGAAGNSVQTEEQDFPLIMANMPATRRQRAMAGGVAILLVAAATRKIGRAHV